MKTPLRLLLLEDDPVDADLVASTLSEAGLEFTAQRVDTRGDFVAALETGAFDLILADYSIPGFDGMTALSLACQQAPDIPFLFVSATIGIGRFRSSRSQGRVSTAAITRPSLAR